VSTHVAAPRPVAGPVRWLPDRVQTQAWLQRLALASVIANVMIVVTGGAVRLTDSGLGCPAWPRCTDSSLVPTSRYGIHGVIEFGNRQLTFVLVLIAAATWLVAMALRRERQLATVAALGIPAQAVLGGFTVLTHLNPWLVALHFLLSMSVVGVTFLLWWRLRAADFRTGHGFVPPAAGWLARLVLAATAAVLVLGTVVTGSGPHAGDQDRSGKVRRTGLQVSSVAQLHADAVLMLVGLTVGLVALVHALGSGRPVQRAAVALLGAELAQGVIGYTQYFLHVPPALVALHMLGACLVWLAALRMALLAGRLRRPSPAARVSV
jgi:cytochrome c oxidase assembly protein subunit 15